MAEYIEREEAIRILSNPITMSMCVKLDECKYKRQQRETDLELIKSLPAEDVQPVKRGRWVFNKPPDDWVMSLYTCDQCSHLEEGKPNYCPNCGARMDGET